MYKCTHVITLSFFPTCRAMNVFRRKYHGNVAFVLSSDDMRWCTQMFRSEKDVHFTTRAAGRGQDVDSVPFDMATLASCNHSIVR